MSRAEQIQQEFFPDTIQSAMLRFLTQSYPEKSKKALGEFLKESSPLTNEEIDTLLSNLSPKIIRDLFVLLKKANLVVIEEKK